MSLSSCHSDNTVKIWATDTAKCLTTLEGHSSRIWQVSCHHRAHFLATASADSTVKVWGVGGAGNTLGQSISGNPTGVTELATLRAHQGDVYSVAVHPTGTHLVSGGYDTTLRLFDLETNKVSRTMNGHQLSVCSTVFNPHGNLIISGSKDNTIKFWDVVSGACVKTFTGHLGEVTSVEMNVSGTYLLTSSKDNSNRLWDVRMCRPIQRYKGHSNTSKNFIASTFGPGQSLVIGGSEDGAVYIWDTQSGQLVQKLLSHTGIVYRAKWNDKTSLLASCSHDGTIKTWWYDSNFNK